ncbi:MAG: ABC transporter permease [Bryobacteraceae bacterium]
MPGSKWLNNFFQDLRYGFRLMRVNPLFATAVVLMLALGIGANTGIFSVMNAVALRSLPVPEPQQLVYLRTTGLPRGANQSGQSQSSFAYPVVEQLRAERDVFSNLMVFVPLASSKVPVRYGNDPEEANVSMVSGNFFSGLGVRRVCGRTLAPEDEASHAQVAVLSHSYWTRRFGGDCSVAGQTLHVGGVPFTIIGVAARGFTGVEGARVTDAWVPLQDRAELNAWGARRDHFYRSPDWWCLMMIGRLAPGMGEKQAQARLNPVFQRAAYAQSGGPRPDEKPANLYFDSARGLSGLRQLAEPLRILLAMVGLVLVIACGNVVLLFVARNTAREREFSIRMAVGGGRARLFQQLITESLLLVAIGTGLAWLFALAATRALGVWSGLDLNLEPDRTVLLFALAVAGAVALVLGIAPLRSVLRVRAGMVQQTASAVRGGDRNRMWGRRIVIALQVSMCVILVAGAGLLVRTLRNLEQVNLGMRTSGLLVFGITAPQRSDPDAIRFFEGLLNRLRTVPGTESVTLMQNRIGSGWSNNTSVYVDGKSPLGERNAPLRWNAVGPDYFRTLGTPVIYGRDLRESDAAGAPKAVIVNETFAKLYLPGQNPLGHQVALSSRRDAPQYQIAGVVANSKYTGVREGDVALAYFSYKQMGGISTMHIEMRTAGNPADSLQAAQSAVREFAPGAPLLQPMTQQKQFENTFAQERLFARLAMFFGLLAVLLVATGVYGTLAYTVSRRTPEVGLRMALGAQRGQVLWMVLRESLAVCAAGIVVGLPLAVACSRLLRRMLFGIAPEDPMTYAVALAGITLIALLASLMPAHRAASINPITALRYD